MSSSSRTPPEMIDIGAPSWCWSQLGTVGEGILSYEASRGRVCLAVPYVVTDRQISIPLASFNETGWRAAGADTQLEVGGLTSGGLRWVVRATAVAERVDLFGQSSLARSRRLHPANGVGSASPTDRLFLREPLVGGFVRPPSTD